MTHMNKLCLYLFVAAALLISGCKSRDKVDEYVDIEKVELDRNLSEIIFSMPTHCLEVEYPNTCKAL